MRGPIAELASMTWREVEALDRGRAVALLPVGALEAHGPHLPLDTDVIIAEAMARAAAERLARRGLIPVLLPSLRYSPALFAAGFPGTVSVGRVATREQLLGIGRSLASHGFTRLGIANAHLDPEHLGALHEAVLALAADAASLRVAFPDLTRRPWGGRLGAEFRSGACHAGRFESSIVMAARPDTVRDSLRSGLDEVPISLSDAMAAGQRTFEEAGGAQAYFGAPAQATAREGRASIATLGEILEEAILESEGDDD